MTVEQAPGSPMQMTIAVFDLPAHPRAGAHAEHVPLLAVGAVRGH